jgi:hypothetical protein
MPALETLPPQAQDGLSSPCNQRGQDRIDDGKVTRSSEQRLTFRLHSDCNRELPISVDLNLTPFSEAA